MRKKKEWCLVSGKRWFSGASSNEKISNTSRGRSSCREELEDRLCELEQHTGNDIHKSAYATLLQDCARLKTLCIGRRLHGLLRRRWVNRDIFLANHLVNMYSRCQSVDEAAQAFHEIMFKNVVSWNIMISAYAYNCRPAEALRLFREMELEGVKPTSVTFVGVVGACAGLGDLSQGRKMHSRVWGELTIVLSTALITMYGKCRGVEDARRVFDGMREKNDVSWNAMIGAYAQQGYGEEALELFHKMDFEPNEVTFVSALDACATIADLAQGKRVLSRIPSLSHSAILSTAAVNMYAKCDRLLDARRVFDDMQSNDVIAWSAMVAAYVQHGDARGALEVYWKMEQEGVRPDRILFISLLDACSCLGDLRQGKRIHARLDAGGFASDSSIASGLVNMYRKCGSLADAKTIFGGLSTAEQLSWNAMIAGYVEKGSWQDALRTFRYMDFEGMKPDGVTFNSLLGAFTSARFLSEGRATHARSVACCIDADVVGVALVKMYGLCGSLEDAKSVFDRLSTRDVVAWSALIGAYAQHGGSSEALELFQEMEKEGVEPNDITFISLLDACASSGDLSQGQEIHAKIVGAGYQSEAFVATALVNMYGKCGDLAKARSVFDKLQPRDVVSWTAMITAYVLHGHHWEALELYFKLEPEGMKVDKVAYLSVLEACASLTALEQGKAIHASIAASGLDSDTGLRNALINFYAKCGCLQDARDLFDGMRCRELVSWNTMITAYGHHGSEDTALEMYRLMHQDGVLPNEVTFVSILFACSHAGLFEEGCRCFGSITADYFMELSLDHYACIIDLLGRSGNLDEAEKLINKMSEACSVVWMTLLAACRIHGDTDRALRTVGQVSELDPASFAGKVLLSNIYAAAGRWHEAAQVRDVKLSCFSPFTSSSEAV